MIRAFVLCRTYVVHRFRSLSELEELRAFTARLVELHARDLHIEKLKAQLAALRRMRFGRSSETLDWQIEQLELAISEIEENEAQVQAEHCWSLIRQ